MTTPTNRTAPLTAAQRLMVVIYPAALAALLFLLGGTGGAGVPAATLQSSAPQAEVTLYGLATVVEGDAQA